MESKPKFDLFIYHDKCMDGLAAVAIATQVAAGATTGESELMPGDYSKDISLEDVRGKRVCFLDFSVKADKMKELLTVATSIHVLDHHIGVYDELAAIEHPNFTFIYDVNLSGAQIAWKYFFPEQKEPLFVSMIGDRDLWTKKYEDSDILNLALRVKEYTYSDMYTLISRLLFRTFPTLDSQSKQLIKEGLSFQEYHEYMVNQICEHAYHAMLDDDAYTDVMKVNCPLGLMSDVGAVLSKRFGVAWLYYELPDSTKHSLRVSADSDFNAASYCKTKGGGGHKKAAGWNEVHLTTSDDGDLNE